MSILIKIDRRTIKPNPSYQEPGTSRYIKGPTEIRINYKGQPSKKQLKHCIVGSTLFFNGRPIEHDLYFIGSEKLAYKLFKKDINDDKCTISIDRALIDVTCKDYGETHIYKYLNPLISCNECGKSIRFNDIETDYDNDSIADVCPLCHALESFDYEHEKLSDVLNTIDA